MKIIHTSDWHIGKLVFGLHMTNDQEFVLKNFLNILKEEKPDVLLVSGDIYDRSVPPTEAVKLLDKILERILSEYNCQVILIAGNHDNPDRLSFASRLLQGQGLHIIGSIEQALKPITIRDKYGEVSFFALPYLEPSYVRHYFQDPLVVTHQNVIEKLLDCLKVEINQAERKVLLYHGFVSGTSESLTSESERPLSIGGTDSVDASLFKDFDYVALGHLHRPQKVQYPHIRYAGSLLKYSFSEHLHKKSITIIELTKDNFNYELRELKAKRDMRRIKGELADLINNASLQDNQDYIEAILTDKGELIDPISKLRAVYPNILSLNRENQFDQNIETTAASDQFKQIHPTELFNEFYENITGDKLKIEANNIIETIWQDIELRRRKE